MFASLSSEKEYKKNVYEMNLSLSCLVTINKNHSFFFLPFYLYCEVDNMFLFLFLFFVTTIVISQKPTSCKLYWGVSHFSLSPLETS